MSKKITTLKQPPSIDPPDGWKDGEGFGFMYGRDSKNQPVDLVRLADLVRWLQTERRLSRKEALQAVMDALPQNAIEWVYQLKPGDSAALIDPDSSFGQDTASVREKKAAKEAAATAKNVRNPSFTRQW